MFSDIYKLKPDNHHKKQKLARHLPSSDTLFIATQQQKQPLMIIASDAYNANRIFDELTLFAPNNKVAIFPDTEVLPYEKVAPQRELIADRLRVLWQINLKQLDIVIVQINTLQTLLCPPEYLNARVLLLKNLDKLSITELRSRLVSSDYSLVDKVFEAGEFAVRGGIIDIIPMGYKNLIRIELFDDEIESLKIIDKHSNQVLNTLEKIELIPAREYPIDKDNLQIFANNFAEGFPEPSNAGFVKEIKHGMLPAGSEFYLPLFFNHTVSLLDYLDDTWQVVFYDNMLDNLNTNWQEINRRYALYSYQYPCLKPVDVFIPTEKVFAKLNQFKNYELAQTGSLDSNITTLPDIDVENKLDNPFTKFKEFIHSFNGQVCLIVESLGRLEIMQQTLANYQIPTAKQNQIAEIKNNKPKLNKLMLINATLYNGFICNNIAFITEQDLYKTRQANISKTYVRRKRSSSITPQFDNQAIIRDLAEIQVGDFVVHINHGIGRYLGLSTQTIADIDYEMLSLEYQNEAKLFVPINNLHLISRYSKIENANIEPNKLGSNAWEKVKSKTEKRINDIAAEILELYAKREMQQGHKFSLPEEYTEFANQFGYEPTIDQETSFKSIIDDMQNHKPMDRLICGDVGFGKTEVAIRAAFICAMNGRQVALLTPTTLLTEQHYQNFVNRFAGFPIKIAEVSRFRTKREIQDTLELVKNGQVDILIGTHRLIQDDIRFANLGLIIIDEEHRFGVKQKEKLKQLRTNVDTLAMTATPIPRTLSMALEGIRDFSIIATPPQRRLAVNTIICNEDKQIMSEAISREIRRGGQIFFLYNDVANINTMYNQLTDLMPELQIAIAHGQMNEHQLELTIRDFIHQRYNILLCSTIIETGIDIANANTILIYRADKLGLAQLHQLRGRVGRSHHQAYCYLIVPENVTKDAEKRLEAIKMTSELGSGFNLALHDLEIRGAGEILGDNQSGDIKEVGLSLYTEMLKKAISKLKRGLTIDKSFEPESTCEVDLNTTSILPDDYCNSVHSRLMYYKRLAKAETIEDVDLVYQEIIDQNGLPPEAVKSLINSHYIRVKAIKLGIKKLDVTSKAITVTFIDKPPLEPIKIILLMQKLKTCKMQGNNKLVWTIPLNDLSQKIEKANYVVDSLN
jgi:transcription-repair coupling factor (superfamily II helicase)